MSSTAREQVHDRARRCNKSTVRRRDFGREFARNRPCQTTDCKRFEANLCRVHKPGKCRIRSADRCKSGCAALFRPAQRTLRPANVRARWSFCSCTNRSNYFAPCSQIRNNTRRANHRMRAVCHEKRKIRRFRRMAATHMAAPTVPFLPNALYGNRISRPIPPAVASGSSAICSGSTHSTCKSP